MKTIEQFKCSMCPAVFSSFEPYSEHLVDHYHLLAAGTRKAGLRLRTVGYAVILGGVLWMLLGMLILWAKP